MVNAFTRQTRRRKTMSDPIIKCEKCENCDAILFEGAECYTCKIKSLERQLAKREDDYRKLRERSDKQLAEKDRQRRIVTGKHSAPSNRIA